jgi:hypothetical protein
MAIHEKILEIIKSMDKVQPFTIGQVVRKLGELNGKEFEGVFEISAIDELETELKKEGLIKEYGTTTLYIKE